MQVCIPPAPTSTPTSTPKSTVHFADSVTVAELHKLTLQSGGGGDDCGSRKRKRKRKRKRTRELTDTQRVQYLAKQRKKEVISGYKHLFMKRICRRYVCYKSGFEKWKELLQ